ncbi:MAG TPA: polysaccharide biosynthesis tyrosine autokinase [Cellvibrio sp.]|nr:polysaccharide biosynthesis tyrosine autokinase [Cellvibrio sp.]
MNDLAQALSSESLLATSTKMGPMLVATGKLSPKDLNMILATQKKHGLRFGEAALKLGLVNADDINAILAEQFAYTQTPAASSKFDRRLSALFQPDSAQAEAMRSLRSELMLRYFNPQQNRSLALVSAEDAAGIGLTTANLAISFAQLGARTLLIDSNLRSPQINQLFSLHEHAPGLSDWIADRTAVVPTPIETVRSLWVLPAGTRAPNPQELLSSRQYQDRLESLVQNFDVTLISTAPMDGNRDAQLVAAQAGAAILVAHAHITRTKALIAIGNRLRELGVRLLGTALRD